MEIVRSFAGAEWIGIFGNLAMIPYQLQYNLMRNVDVMIGAHGAVFSWSLVFNSHKMNQKMFEISIPNAPLHNEHWAKMLNIRGYHQHICTTCCQKRMKQWRLCPHSRVNVEDILNELHLLVNI